MGMEAEAWEKATKEEGEAIPTTAKVVVEKAKGKKRAMTATAKVKKKMKTRGKAKRCYFEIRLTQFDMRLLEQTLTGVITATCRLELSSIRTRTTPSSTPRVVHPGSATSYT